MRLSQKGWILLTIGIISILWLFSSFFLKGNRQPAIPSNNLNKFKNIAKPISAEEREKEEKSLSGKYKFDTRKNQYKFTKEQKLKDDKSFTLIASCERELERMKNWYLKFAQDDTVMVIASNYGFRTFLLNSWCSMDNVDSKIRNKMVLWALDWRMYEFLKNLTYPLGPHQFGVFYDPNLVGVEDLVPGGAGGFDDLMGIRPKFLANFARTGLHLLFVDADITWYDDPWKNIFTDEIRESNPDWIFTLDARDVVRPERFQDLFIPELCAGMYWMKGNEKNIRVWEMVYKIMVTKKDGSDQNILNYVLGHHALLVGPSLQGFHIGVTNNSELVSPLAPRIAILNQMQFINGYIYKNYHDKYCSGQDLLASKGKGRVMVHGNWWHSDKLADFRKIPDIWFLEKDDMTCKPYRNPKTIFGCSKEEPIGTKV